ncbi:MAG: Gfo/Idh/MocA family oxidoreductase [Phycisphaerales bacterium]|nr:Gfo/Idh/MocA family oxidoreductase [Phycisphaerales bacterium]
MNQFSSDWTRRNFVKATAALGAGTLIPSAFAARIDRSIDDTIRVGVIGCGGRGTGAAANAIKAHPKVKIVAMADLFEDRLKSSHGWISEDDEYMNQVDVDPANMFVGFDAYQKLLAIDSIDYVILATPPGFRPIHMHAAVHAGKHVFMEKPVAVDPAGIRKVLEAGERAKASNLSVVAGTQRRHERSYLSLMDRVHNEQLGEIVSASCYWNQGGLWVHDRKPEYSDMEWQCRNWLYFAWLSGDHICEQHIHNIDVINWAMGGPPVKATGMGGRQVRTDPKYGNIFDHFSIEYEYPNGITMQSMCRQIDGCAVRVEEVLVGSHGRSVSRPGYAIIDGQNAWRFEGENPNPYEQEHVDLIASITGKGAYLNESKQVAESTLTAIMGRMSAYTGKSVQWSQAMESKLDLAPKAYEMSDLPVRPVAVPGKTPLI